MSIDNEWLVFDTNVLIFGLRNQELNSKMKNSNENKI